MIPILSPSFFNSPACRAELTFAANNGKLIIPVLAEPFTECPLDMEMILQGANPVPPKGEFEVR